MKDLIFKCPYCNNLIIINEKDLNCCIFRHGVLKTNNKQIDPHTPKEICDNLVKNNLIFGCGKPFKIVKNNEIYKIEKCGYI